MSHSAWDQGSKCSPFTTLWQAVEVVLIKLIRAIATRGKYLQTWTLKLRTTKTLSAVFHLNNKEAKRELKVNFNDETCPFCSEPKYFGVTLHRTLTYRRHLVLLRKKLTSSVALLGCWDNNVANSNLSPGPFNSRVL